MKRIRKLFYFAVFSVAFVLSTLMFWLKTAPYLEEGRLMANSKQRDKIWHRVVEPFPIPGYLERELNGVATGYCPIKEVKNAK